LIGQSLIQNDRRCDFRTVLPSRLTAVASVRACLDKVQQCSQYAHFGPDEWVKGERMDPLFTRVNTASMATFLKIAARISAIGTFILAALILGWQVTSWISTDEWYSFPISRALSLAHLGPPAIYVTASVPESPPSLNVQTIYDWFLDLPAGGFLLAVAAVLLGFSFCGASVEKQFIAIDK
jgi:hypothetical protein